MAQKQPVPPRDLQTIVNEVAVYPPEAYEFVELGLQHTMQNLHADTPPDDSHHVSGQQLSLGLRDYAWMRWGPLARMVLARWNVTSTMDFGKIVYALIDARVFSKTDADRQEDFRNVFDFRTLESSYAFPAQAASLPCPSK